MKLPEPLAFAPLRALDGFSDDPKASNEARLEEIDISRVFSSGAASETVVPSATEPRRLIAPA